MEERRIHRHGRVYDFNLEQIMKKEVSGQKYIDQRRTIERFQIWLLMDLEGHELTGKSWGSLLSMKKEETLQIKHGKKEVREERKFKLEANKESLKWKEGIIKWEDDYKKQFQRKLYLQQARTFN
jgi:hypothetical protein